MEKYDLIKATKHSMIGRVLSTKCSKSITVAIHRKKYIAKYQRYLRHTKKVMAHDEEEKCDVGDIVRIIPCQQKSKKKRHALFEILVKEQTIERSTLAALPAQTTEPATLAALPAAESI
jgi:small subunit ribosomal protein S17